MNQNIVRDSRVKYERGLSVADVLPLWKVLVLQSTNANFPHIVSDKLVADFEGVFNVFHLSRGGYVLDTAVVSPNTGPQFMSATLGPFSSTPGANADISVSVGIHAPQVGPGGQALVWEKNYQTAVETLLLFNGATFVTLNVTLAPGDKISIESNIVNTLFAKVNGVQVLTIGAGPVVSGTGAFSIEVQGASVPNPTSLALTQVQFTDVNGTISENFLRPDGPFP